jgi:tRNA pseudouridine38-40 synthase
MVGTCVWSGKGKFNSSDVKDIIKSRDRSKAGATAPAQGLYLLKVEY